MPKKQEEEAADIGIPEEDFEEMMQKLEGYRELDDSDLSKLCPGIFLKWVVIDNSVVKSGLLIRNNYPKHFLMKAGHLMWHIKPKENIFFIREEIQDLDNYISEKTQKHKEEATVKQNLYNAYQEKRIIVTRDSQEQKLMKHIFKLFTGGKIQEIINLRNKK